MKFLNINTELSIEEIVEEFEDYMKNEGYTGADLQYYKNIPFRGFYMVYDIDWGDWTHDHGWFKFLVHSFFLSYNIDMDISITEEDGSDAYSAEYGILITQ